MEISIKLKANKDKGKLEIEIPIETALTMTRASLEAMLRLALMDIDEKTMKRLLNKRETGTVTITIETGTRKH